MSNQKTKQYLKVHSSDKVLNTGLKAISFLCLFCIISSCNRTSRTQEEAVNTESFVSQLEQLKLDADKAKGIRDIKRLQWAYGHYSEFGLWHDFADLFSEQAVGHYPAGELNRDEIRTLFFEQVGQGQLGLAEGRLYPHISFSPVISMAEDGLSAQARFRIIAMLGGYGGNATWAHGLYENGYVLQDDSWQISELGYHGQAGGNFTNGLSSQVSGPLDQPTVSFHYTIEEVGQLSETNDNFEASALNNATSDIFNKLTTLEQSIRALRDEQEILNLQHTLGVYFDNKQWNQISDLLAEDATMEFGQSGQYIGKQSVTKGLNQFGNTLLNDEINNHLQFQTYVSISTDGLSAKARVDELGLEGQLDDSAVWTQGIYENEFIKVNEEWKINSIHYYPRLITDFDLGWGEDAQIISMPNEGFSADLPPSEVFKLYPDFYIPAFHFSHPVTGLAPQYPAGESINNNVINLTEESQITISDVNVNSDISVQGEINKLKQQLVLLNAYDATENLINAYNFYLDECMMEQAASLFSIDGENEIPGIGIYIGPEHIATALKMAWCPSGRQISELTLHHTMQPIITVADDGYSASINTKLWQVHASDQAEDYYLWGTYKGVAVNQDGHWKIKSLQLHYNSAISAARAWEANVEYPVINYAAPLNMASELSPDKPAINERVAQFPDSL